MDIWSVGIIFFNMATARNPWVEAYRTGPYDRYVAQPESLMEIMPISLEFFQILRRILTNSDDRVDIHELENLITRSTCPRFLKDDAYT